MEINRNNIFYKFEILKILNIVFENKTRSLFAQNEIFEEIDDDKFIDAIFTLESNFNITKYEKMFLSACLKFYELEVYASADEFFQLYNSTLTSNYIKEKRIGTLSLLNFLTINALWGNIEVVDPMLNQLKLGEMRHKFEKDRLYHIYLISLQPYNFIKLLRNSSKLSQEEIISSFDYLIESTDELPQEVNYDLGFLHNLTKKELRSLIYWDIILS